MQDRQPIKRIVVDQIVRHAERSDNWKECCADLIKGHDIDPTEIEHAIQTRRKIAIDRAGALTFYCLVAYGCNALTILMAPGFILPFLNHPIGRLIAIGAVTWSMIGIVIISRSSKSWQYPFATIIFGFPVTLAPLLGPAVVTIIQAFK